MKGQGLSISTIVLAALAIIVLIVLVTIVVQRSTQFGTGVEEVGTQNCVNAGGKAMPIGTMCDVVYGNFDDVPSGKICCKEGTIRQ